MPTSYSLSPHLEHFVREQVESGRYNNASEVVRAGLRLLEDEQKRSELQLDALREAIRAGVSAVPTRSADEVFDRLEARLAARVADADSAAR
jgi:antitoxin ParD1/3/4